MKLWVGDDGMSKKHKKIIKNDKDSVENEYNRKKKNCDYDAKFNS